MLEEEITPDLQSSLICEDVRQEQNGIQSLIGVLNAIPAPAFPVRVMKLCLWTRWCSGMGTFKQTSRIVAPDEQTIIAESNVEFTLQQLEMHTTNVHFFAGLQFPEPGVCHVEIRLGNDLRVRYPLPIIQIQPPPNV